MSTQRSVILALESPLPPRGALRLRICEFMQSLGGEVHLIVFGETPGVFPLPAPYRGLIEVVSLPARPPQSRLSRLVKPPAVISGFTSREYARAVERAVQSTPDLVFAVGMHVARYLELVPRPIPRMFDDHDVVWLVHSRKASTFPSRTGIGRLLLHWEAVKVRFWERRLLRSASLVTAISETDAAQLRRLAGEVPVHVVGPTVPQFSEERGLSETVESKPPVLVFTGVFSYEPNIMGAEWFCRQVLPLLQAQVGDVQVQLVGRDAGEPIHQLAALPNVTVVGEVPNIAPYIRNAKVSIVPLLFGSGVRYKILEAFSLGTPVVSTSIGCEGLNLCSERHLLIADSPQDFARACRRLVEDGQLRTTLVEQGNRFVSDTNAISKRSLEEALIRLFEDRR